MIPILLGSVVGFAIVLERVIAFLKISSHDGQQCLHRVLQHTQQGRMETALKATRDVDHPVAAMLRRGLEQWDLPIEAVERAMEQAAQAQVRGMERWLGGLASVITLEPMLGFLGTITGLIRAFMMWEASGARVTVSQLASGIYEAMITTAAGLIVAIPLLMAHNAFISRIKRLAGFLTDAAHDLLDLHVRAHLPSRVPDETAHDARLPAHR
ncbi:MAG: MotA/TolQ/ExbB proton channel family protein [Candidatus Omnitrophica bacterium]|nr:MotA/TolQ/ExbB proton channel family protein [Candidatus Omnitrophota bacterium]